MKLPEDDNERKAIDFTAQWKLFPKATVALASHIKTGADKYCGGIIKWDRSKSPDELGSLLRHAFEWGTADDMPVEHAKAIAWRAMALLEKTLEREESGIFRDPIKVGQEHIHGLEWEEAGAPADLWAFLDSEGCWDEYAMEHGNWTSEFFQPENRYEWINAAFWWEETQSGGEFWSGIDKKWQAYLWDMEEDA